MLRSVKYGAYAAALAGVVGGTVAFTATSTADKSVRLLVDGRPTIVHTTAGDVRSALSGAGYKIGAHDLVAPAASSEISNGETVVYKRGRVLHLTVDGVERDVWTTAPTVAQALSQLGYTGNESLSVSRSRRLPLGVTDIAMRTPKRVTVAHDGRRSTVTTTDATVGQLLSDLSLTVGTYDRLSTAQSAPVVDGARVTLTRVQHRAVMKTTVLPHATRTVDDATMFTGRTKVVTAGRDGLAKISYAVIFVDGKRVGTTKYRRVVVRGPRTRIEHVGTKARPRPAPSYDGSPESAQAIAKAMMLRDYGWGDGEFGCLVDMWNRESGWRPNAANSSGAYGIPQSLPGSKMSAAGPNWESDATTQIRWGLQYIASRYNTPCQAWGLWQQQGWY